MSILENINFFGKKLTGRNLDSSMMYIGKYLVQQEKDLRQYFNLNQAIVALQQNYGFVSQDKIEDFIHECHNFYTLQKNRRDIEINRGALKSFKTDVGNGLTIRDLSQQNQNELHVNLQSILNA